MASFNLPVAREISPEGIFFEMPSGFRLYLRRGFDQLAQVDQSKIGMLVDILAEGVDATDEAGVTEIIRRLELKIHDRRAFGAALGLLLVIVTSREDLKEVVEAGVKADAITKTSEDRVLALATELQKGKSVLSDAVGSASLANEVAPSFMRLDIAVELRFAFDELKVSKTVPVAICYLDTDSDENQCFFQLKKRDITQLISQLKRAEVQLNAIEAWAKERR